MAHLALQRASYAEAETLLAGGRDKRMRRIGHNTYVHALYGTDDRLAILLHSTDILTLTRDGWVIVDLSGWRSSITMQRVHALLPGGWYIGRNGKRGHYLYRSHQPVLPFADGLAINVDTGAVGFSTDRANVGPLLSADDVAAAVAAGEARQAERDAKRAARMLAQHPDVRPDPGVGSLPSPHGRNRPYGCERCEAEWIAERDRNRAILAAEHAAMAATLARNPTDAEPWTDAEYAAAGSHITRRTDYDWPKGPDGRTDYSGHAIATERVIVGCPWGCPQRDYTKGY